VLPGYFFTGLKQLAQMDMSGARLATQVWDKFAAQQTTVANKVRTIRMKVGSEVYRVIRSCVSQEYADYSNLEFVQDILDNAGEYSNLPVVDWRVSDSGMRIRFAAMDSAFFGFANLDQSVLLEEPLPMVEAWNSEVGRRRVGLRAGMWRLASTSGLGHWNAVTEYNWTHRGRTSRIQTGVQTAYSNLFSSANEVILAYQEARSITIDNAEVWMEQELKLMPDVPKRVIVASISALTDPTTTKGGVLASVVDAITLAAQSETDIFSQHDIERAASRLLMKGRAIAARNDGNIPVEA
jgi:hypothetical protein